MIDVPGIDVRTTIEQDLEPSLQASIQKGTTSQLVFTSEGGAPLAKMPVGEWRYLPAGEKF